MSPKLVFSIEFELVISKPQILRVVIFTHPEGAFWKYKANCLERRMLVFERLAVYQVNTDIMLRN